MEQKRILALFQLPARKYSPLPLNAQGGPTGWLAKNKKAGKKSKYWLPRAGYV